MPCLCFFKLSIYNCGCIILLIRSYGEIIRKTAISSTFLIKIKVSSVPLWIGHGHLCIKCTHKITLHSLWNVQNPAVFAIISQSCCDVFLWYWHIIWKSTSIYQAQNIGEQTFQYFYVQLLQSELKTLEFDTFTTQIDSSTIDGNVEFAHSQYSCILTSQVSIQFFCPTTLSIIVIIL